MAKYEGMLVELAAVAMVTGTVYSIYKVKDQQQQQNPQVGSKTGDGVLGNNGLDWTGTDYSVILQRSEESFQRVMITVSFSRLV